MGTLTLLILVIGIGVLNAYPEYIFTFPQNLEAGQETSFCLSAQYIDIEDWQPGDAYDVVVYLTFFLPAMEEVYINGTGIQISGITTPEFSNCPMIQAPKKPGHYKAEVTASILFKETVQDIFNAKNEIHVHKPNLITLIQTDKPVYKPGQTVKFRAITMDYQLMAKDYGFTEIFITAPNRDRAAQWRNVTTQKGLVSLEMPLLEEPILGEWKINAAFEEGYAETTFKVEEYVLPKFEVTITPPTYLLPTTKTIAGKVCAKYTFGKPVKGTMEMSMCLNDGYSENARPCAKTFVQKFDGCHEFFIDADTIELKSKRYWYYPPLRINATVVDEANGVEQHGESEGPRLTRFVLNMKFEDDSSGYYKPAFPYKGRLVITNPDGSPAIGESVEIVARSHYDNFYWPFGLRRTRDEIEYMWKREFESDLNGIVHFVITDVPPSVGYLQLRASSSHADVDERFRFDSEEGAYITTERPEAYKQIRRWYSASDSYIYIPDVDKKVKCGSKLELDVYYTTPEETTYNFQTMVKAGDRIVSTKAKEVKFDGISNLNVLSVRPEQLLDKTLACGGTLYSRAGILTSPNYPDFYDREVSCVWVIRTYGLDRITLNFTNMDIEGQGTCAFDYVEVRDGHHWNASLIGRFCGQEPPASVTSTGNVMYIKFESASTVSRPGFEANWRIVPLPSPSPPPEPEVPIEKRSAEEAIPVNEEIIVPEEASLLGNEEIDEGDQPIFEEEPPHLIGHFKLVVNVTGDMSPDASVIVYYMRDDGEIIASTIKFDIEPCFKNKVEMDFKEKTLLPGSEAEFTLKASPSSTCFVGMVDKSINLLGGQNQITPTQIYKEVRKVSRVYRWGGGSWESANSYCRKKYPELMSGPGYDYHGHYGYYLTAIGVDASKSFKDFDLWVVTDGVVETRPCKKEEHVYYHRPMPLFNEAMPDSMIASPGGGRPGPVARGQNVQVTAERVEVEDEETVPEPDRIRSLFPESWLWDIYPVGDEGESTVTTTIPDTITEWVGNSLCTNPKDGVGVSEMTSVTGFKPFFVSLTLPYAAVRGETLSVPVTVYNYLDKCVRLDLRVEGEETFELHGKENTRFCLCGSETHTVNFKITPLIIGEIELLVKAVSTKDNGACTNYIITEDYLGVSDGVQRHLLVDPEGIPQEKTVSEYVCVSGNVPFSMPVHFDMPDEMVLDSERAYVSVVGDIMGPALSNLENLLRMPYGCGEQNMASWAPNIYVLQYLTNTGQLTSKLEEEAKGYMRVGYKRQMKYRHDDSSYSAFGQNNNNNSGSIWLTAFVIKSMAQSSEFITIREDDIETSVKWIIDQQNEDGCFPQVGKVFSSYMKGGLSSGKNPVGLTAFIMIALLEAGIGNIKNKEYYQIGKWKGLDCLRNIDPGEVDTYTLAVMTYTFAISGLQYETELFLRYLDKRKVSESGLEYWKRESLKEEEKGYWWRHSSAEVEMTAYAVLAKLMYGMEDAIGETQPIIQWLTKQRNPYGGFSSTQDTVVALQALAMFGDFTYSGDSDLNIQIKNNRIDKSIKVTSENLLLTQKERVEPDDGPLTITSSGEGCALIQVSTRYSIHEEKKTKVKPFMLQQFDYLSIKEEKNCAKRALRICSKYKLPGSSNMAIIEVKMQTGWEPVAGSIKELQDHGLIARFEVDKNYVQLYFEEISSEKKCVVFEVEETMKIENAQKAVIRIYDYYETDLSVSEKYKLSPSCKRSPEDDKEKIATKEDIPPNNEGLNCTFMQCRVGRPPKPTSPPRPTVFVPVGCPRCKDTMEIGPLKEAVCDAQLIYKATVGRKGVYKIKIMSNFTTPSKIEIGAFVNPEMDENCKCSVLEHKNKKAFFMTIPQTWETASNKSVIKLGAETLIVKRTRLIEKAIMDVKNRKNFCKRMERRRRSRARKNKNRRRSGALRNI